MMSDEIVIVLPVNFFKWGGGEEQAKGTEKAFQNNLQRSRAVLDVMLRFPTVNKTEKNNKSKKNRANLETGLKLFWFFVKL